GQNTANDFSRSSTECLSNSYFFGSFLDRDDHYIAHTHYSGDQSPDPHQPQKQPDTSKKSVYFIKLFFQIEATNSPGIVRRHVMTGFQYRIYFIFDVTDLVAGPGRDGKEMYESTCPKSPVHRGQRDHYRFH